MVKCLICNIELEKQIHLTNHLKKYHSMSYKKYYDTFLLKEGEGICLTCGKETKFERNQYRQFCSVKCMRQNKDIQEKTRQTSIERHGGVGLESKEIRLKAEQTNIERYGVKNPYMIEEVKKNAHSKEAVKKYKETMLDRYGVDSPIKIEENLNKVIKASHTEEINKKRIESTIKSNLEKFSVKYNFQREDVKTIIKNSFKRKYGVEYPKQYELFKIKDRNTKYQKMIDFCLKNDCTPNQEVITKYGTGWYQSEGFLDALIKYNGILFVRNSYLDEISKYKPNPAIYRSSNFEKEIYQYVLSIYDGKVIHNDRKLIKPLELDIYIPDKNIAIECNGLYWHSTKNGIDTNYHLNKTKLCKDKDVRLIHIFENEWNEKNDICKSIIASALGIYKERIYARKCIIKEVSKIDEQQFLSKNNLYDYDKSNCSLGLFYKNELVQIMSIRQIDKTTYNINRTCTKLNTQVVGGFSKLLSHIDFDNLIASIDISKFNGYSYFYEFKLDRILKPSYFYWSYEYGSIYDESIIKEKKLDESMFLKLYDCGQYILKRE